MTASTIRFIAFPRTEPPPSFCAEIVAAFVAHEQGISTKLLKKGLTSNEVLTALRDDLIRLGFQVEAGPQKNDKIQRPVFFGEGGTPTLNYQIDAYHPQWRCGFEVEAGRAWMGNAIYRDLIQGLVMVQVDTLVLAVPNGYRYQSGGRSVVSSDFANTVSVAESLYGHTRLKMPYGLIVIGY
ncbi:MAG TPA: hypothetical protein VN700_19030 [Vicinamibacterales bacterium]|nr:hypothetical protein [Vicinamibacterales bacterium]